MKTTRWLAWCLTSTLCWTASFGAINHDVSKRTLMISDGSGALQLRLNYDGRCLLDRVSVRGRETVAEATGVCSAIKVGDRWFTTRAGLAPVLVNANAKQVTITGIRFGGGGVDVEETWEFTPQPDGIVWRIDRTYLAGGMLDDTYFPGWDFSTMSVWTGALLGHGGVAWSKLFDAPNATYGVHNGEVVFWNKESRAALGILPRAQSGEAVAVRFSRQPSGIFSFNYTISERELQTRRGLSRFLRDRQDLWAAFPVRPGKMSIEYTLRAFDYGQAYDLGKLKLFDSATIREIRHTIARIGAVDKLIHGSNGYYSDYAVLHEPWLAQMGLLIDDPNYTRAFGETLDFQRLHAIGADGRVKSRWCGTAGDALPGTYDAYGYYEAQWGYLLDSQPSWVINVAELFDLSGDRAWLQRQKSACEAVLEYMLRRDSDGNGLLEVLTDSCKQAKGSDWIDVVWASYENGLANAQMYAALALWADREELLGDKQHADRYRAAAQKLKTQFNRPIAEGGLWDPQNQCYDYWRDKDGSIHGTNLVVPVNFSAIGYGLCDDPARRAAILKRVEALMQQEKLFFWPLCFSTYAPAEAHPSQYPFPTYENGDLFLAWGELGTRVYAAHDPAIAVKYVKSVLDRYDRDGLAFQRYVRKAQTGAGSDILANNCSTIVGLYRNIYGIQPRHDRLLLAPHLVPELDGTQVKYGLRGQSYTIDLNTGGYRMALEDFTLQDSKPFAVSVEGNQMRYFVGEDPNWALSVTRSSRAPVQLQMESWSPEPQKPRRWTASCPWAGVQMKYVIADLQARARYDLRQAGKDSVSLVADGQGRAEFTAASGATTWFELRPGR